MHTKKGIPVSRGIAIAPAVILDSEEYQIPRRGIDRSLCPSEIERVHSAFDNAIRELAALEAQHHELGQIEIRDIFAVHRHFLQDQRLRQRVIDLINAEAVTAEYAVTTAMEKVRQYFWHVQDRYISKRASDIIDIEKRVLKHLIDIKQSSLQTLDHEVIVVAKDLRPTQTASFDPRFVKGIACDTGGKTSHASIVARAMGIPAVVALEDLTGRVQSGDMLIVDGNSGTVILHPDPVTIHDFQEAAHSLDVLKKNLDADKHEPAVTRDGAAITLLANIEFPDEVDHVLDAGADGIGLFRTEFLYLRSGVEPSEETHYQAYTQVVKAMTGRPVTIRTMDLGADKLTQSHRFTPETNPSLGLRSIRFSLKHRDMFVAQLRAILRASVLGPVKIMYPLITHRKELLRAREVLTGVMADLRQEGVPFDQTIPVGIMIEVPSAALMSRILAKEADFFSIGTNDLTQYTLAVDRGNAQVSELFSPAEPAVLHLIKTTVAGAKTTGIDVSICGEMAAETRFIMPLLGLGIRTLSLTPTMIPEIKKIIRSVRMQDCETVARTVLNMESAEDITDYLDRQTRHLLSPLFQ